MQKPPVQTYRYRIEHVPAHVGGDDLVKRLNELGAQGWYFLQMMGPESVVTHMRPMLFVGYGDTDLYAFMIESESIVMVEDILAFFKEHAGKQSVFQEELTRQCAVALGAKVTSVGWHSGVKVTCEAP